MRTAPLYVGVANYELGVWAVEIRHRLIDLGFTPMTTVDFSKRRGQVIEYFRSNGGQTVAVFYAPDGTAKL